MTGKRETCAQCGEPLLGDGTCGGCRNFPNACPCDPTGTDPGLPHGDDQDGGRKSRPAQSKELLDLADKAGFCLGTDPGDEPFGVRAGEKIARMLRGGRGSVRAELSRAYAEAYGRAPAKDALAEALLVLEGRAYVAAEHELELRAARRDDTVWLDLGTTGGDLAKITAAGWEITRDAPVLFRRTRLTGALPEPASGGDLGALRGLLRVSDDAWPLVVAWLLSVLLLPGQPVPVLEMTGEQGTAKSWQSRLLVATVDPGPVPLRAVPRDVESWIVAAASSRVVALDNLSHIEPWLSDALCRAVTGDGLVRRALYTDNDVSVLAFRRAVLVNGISLGRLRPDLADRLIRITLGQLADTDRLDEADLAGQWDKAHPAVLGGLLDLAVGVLATLPRVRQDSWPRMADYARILAAVDKVMGTKGLKVYMDERSQLAGEVVADNPVARALASLAGPVPWEGTAADLLAVLPRPDGPDGERWPGSPRAMTAAVDRAAPPLRQTGTEVTDITQRDGRRQAKRWRITALPKVAGERTGRTNVQNGPVAAGHGATGGVHVQCTLLGGDVPGRGPGTSTAQRADRRAPDVQPVSADGDVADVGDVLPLPREAGNDDTPGVVTDSDGDPRCAAAGRHDSEAVIRCDGDWLCYRHARKAIPRSRWDEYGVPDGPVHAP